MKELPAFKEEFLSYLVSTGALFVTEDRELDRTLKSKRRSSWFVNIGDFNDGESLEQLGKAYARAIKSSGVEFDILYGIPEKGYFLAAATAFGLWQEFGINAPIFATRKEVKTYGEASNLSHADLIKASVVGRAPKPGQKIITLDDVFTAGDAKYEARRTLEGLGEFEYPLLIIAVDRQEVGIDSKSAIGEYEEKTGTKVLATITAADVVQYLSDRIGMDTPNGPITGEAVERLVRYLRVYGTEQVHSDERVGRIGEQRIISPDRSVIPACDVKTLDAFKLILEATAGNDKIGGYKIGFKLGLKYGLERVVSVAREFTELPIIYDHQKAGTDIPDTGKDFAEVCSECGVNAVILFPQAGPETERAWIYHALDYGLQVIVGGRMTHPAYAVSEGGFITDDGAMEMYRIAAGIGVTNFVVPGNKPDVITDVRTMIEEMGVKPSFYAPGFIAQGGVISDAAKAAGDRFHGIVGRDIYTKKTLEEMRESADSLTDNL